MAFLSEVTVRFYEVDRAGIAFFGRVFEYCHVAFEEMLAAAENDLTSVFDDEGWGMPLVHTEADFKSPMRMGERLTVALTVERIGDSSITFAYRLTGPKGDLKATARLIHSVINLSTFRKRSMPERILKGLDRLNLLPDGYGGGDASA